jgi:conjugative transfer pilus assembly protein TraH
MSKGCNPNIKGARGNKVLKYQYLMKTLFVILITTITTTNSLAGGLDGFLKFAGQDGSMTSINKAAVIDDQKAGYMTGGSIISRGPRPMDLQPVGVQLPSLEFDPCTGSGDLRWGGFSYIKSAEFARYFKAVAASAGAYTAKMFIKQACPQCEDIMSYLESVARDINGMTFGQCQQGKALADGLISKFNSSQSQKCLAKSSIAKGGSDLHEATQKCQDDPNRYGERGDNEQLKSMLPDNFNLVWKALSHGDGKAPSGMKELIMSISGSIIGTKDKGISTLVTLPSLVEKEDLLEQYIGKPGAGSSKIKLYVCDETSKCLKPAAKESTVNNRKETLYGKIETTLTSILDKIESNKGTLSDEEQALIEYSQIPIITLFEIELARKNKESVSMLAGNSEFVEVVCYDMVTNFMQKMLHEAKTAVDTIKTAQLDNTAIDRFNHNIESVQELLRDKKYHAMDRLQTIIAVKERLSKQQDVFEMNFSRFASNRGR